MPLSKIAVQAEHQERRELISGFSRIKRGNL